MSSSTSSNANTLQTNSTTRPSAVNSKSQTTSSWKNNAPRSSKEDDIKSSEQYPLANEWTFYHDKWVYITTTLVKKIKEKILNQYLYIYIFFLKKKNRYVANATPGKKPVIDSY
jgi:hypothetical protein